MTNLEKLESIFPECVTEAQDADGNLRRAIDFEKLRQILTGELADEHESYEFNFVGKKRAHFEAYAPIRKTLRPVISESRDFDSTQNIYIEGDNLDALKLLAESYLGKVKMIYIDPPYNTGNDLIYRDDFTQDVEDYEEAEGVFDEAGNRLFVNRESHGRFHSDWCAMIYSRLLIAKHFLSPDGVIFISIDDHEQANLKKICDEVFGENNFIAKFCVKRSGGRQDSKFFAVVNEYLICYAKDTNFFVAGEEIKINDAYPKFDAERNRYYKTQLLRKWGANSRRIDRPNLFYPIPAPDGSELYPMLSKTEEGRWRWGKNKMKEAFEDGRVEFINDESKTVIEGCWRWGKDKMRRALDKGLIEFVKKDGEWTAYEKIYQPLAGEENTKKFTTWIEESFSGAETVKNLLGDKIFPYPKSVGLIKRVLQMGNADKNSVVMDFFSGSATTAQAVMEMNSQDGGRRRFIMVQLPEETSESSDAFRAGYKTICEIGKERIRRAGDKLKAEHPDLDIGFRVFRVDSSNFLEPPKVWTQQILDLYIENIKADRDEYDLFFGAILEMGLTLDKSFAEENFKGFRVLSYDGKILACFERNIPAEICRALALRQPKKILFRDASFRDSVDKINALEFFKYFAPRTEVRVL